MKLNQGTKRELKSPAYDEEFLSDDEIAPPSKRRDRGDAATVMESRGHQGHKREAHEAFSFGNEIAPAPKCPNLGQVSAHSLPVLDITPHNSFITPSAPTNSPTSIDTAAMMRQMFSESRSSLGSLATPSPCTLFTSEATTLPNFRDTPVFGLKPRASRSLFCSASEANLPVFGNPSTSNRTYRATGMYEGNINEFGSLDLDQNLETGRTHLDSGIDDSLLKLFESCDLGLEIRAYQDEQDSEVQNNGRTCSYQ